MKRIFVFCLLFVVVMTNACRNKEVDQVAQSLPEQRPTLSAEELDNYIQQTVQQTKEPFDWNKASTEAVWSALKHSDQILSVGYNPEDSRQARQAINADLKSDRWQEAKQQVLTLIWEEEKKVTPSLKLEDVVSLKEIALPILFVKITNPNTIARLRASKLVRYAEPSYEPAFAKQPATQDSPSGRVPATLGCAGVNGYPAKTNLQKDIDYSVISVNSWASWNYRYHRIQDAWSRGYNGKNIMVYLFDTGLNPNQDNLRNPGFSLGAVTGRKSNAITALQLYTQNSDLAYEEPDDYCGHGTALAGVIGAPRRGNQSMAGVAYGCNLTSVKVAGDVYIDDTREIRGVAEGFLDAIISKNSSFNTEADKPKIVSMSIGRVGSSSVISEAIIRAHEQGMLIFSAAGTAPWLISGLGSIGKDGSSLVFPSNMPETVTVTGVTSAYTRCAECVDGRDVDFVVVMEKGTGGAKTPLGMSGRGNIPTTIGGSSVATATMAGMAAIVWQRFPNLSSTPQYQRDAILNKLRLAADKGTARHSNYGWGIVNMEKATR